MKLTAKQAKDMFPKLCRAAGLQEPVREYKFAKAAMKRKWAFDYAWLSAKIAVECDGGVWIKGRHTRGTGFIKDMEKLNAASSLGWRVFRFTPQTLCSNETLKLLHEVLT